jgi:TPR repeat protein
MKGQGGPADINRAVHLLKAAAAQGLALAHEMLHDVLKSRGFGSGAVGAQSVTDSTTTVGDKLESAPDVCRKCGKSGKLLQCSRCKEVKYCNPNCQTTDWKVHKKTCK